MMQSVGKNGLNRKAWCEMARYIDADALINFLDETVPYEEMLVSQYNADWIYSFIECAPTIEARPVVRGEWIEKPHTDGFGGHYFLYHCSRCDTPNASKRNFCNECGADLRGDGDGRT